MMRDLAHSEEILTAPKQSIDSSCDTKLLFDFSINSGVRRFADFNPPAWCEPIVLGKIPCQQNIPIPDHDRADPIGKAPRTGSECDHGSFFFQGIYSCTLFRLSFRNPVPAQPPTYWSLSGSK